MSLTRKIAYNTLVQSVGRVLSAFIGFGVIAATARYLGRAGFGQYTTVMAFSGFFSTIAGMGISLVVTNEIGKKNLNINKFLSNAFSLRIFTSAAILGLGALAGFLMPYPALVKQAIAVDCFAFFLLSFRHVFDGLFFRELKTLKLVLAEILGRLLTLGLVLWSVWKVKGLLNIVWAVAWGNLVQSLLVYLFTLPYAKIRFEANFKVWKYIFHRSWPLALSMVFNLIYFKFDTIILSLLKPEADVGIYGAAYKILELLIAFPILFCSLVLPQFALHRNSDPARFQRIFQKSFDFLIVGTVPLAICIFFFAPQMIHIISGPDFDPSIKVLQILSIAIGIIFLAALPSHLIVALDQQKKMIWGYLVGAIFAVSLDLILIPLFSYVGAAVTTVLVELLILIWSFYLVRKSYHLPWKKGILGRSIMAGAVLFSFFILFPSWNFVVKFACGAALYLVVLYLLGGLPKDILKESLSIKK